MRRLGVPFTVLAALGALQLYLFPQDTDRFFSWTLQPHLSAMFMGAGFAAGVALTVMSFRRQPWVITRLAAVAIFVFVTVMAGATFLHLELMHLDSESATARAAAWLWVAVYGVLPPAMMALFVLQSRRSGSDPPRTTPMPAPLRVSLLIHGVVMTSVGIALLIWPVRLDSIWPWPVTALAGRALAAWLLAIGVAALWAQAERDMWRTRPAAITLTIAAGLWLIAVARGAADMRWERPSAWLYVAWLVATLVTGVWGWRASSQASDSERGASPGVAGARRSRLPTR